MNIHDGSDMKQLYAIGTLMLILSLLFAGNLNAEVFTVTAYCSCEKCCNKDYSDKWYGITATGKKAKWGTVAVDRSVVEMGSRMKIEGFPKTTFRAEDVGGAIKGNRIDVWFPTHREALKYSAKEKEVCFLE